jgi:hypothetical protein
LIEDARQTAGVCLLRTKEQQVTMQDPKREHALRMPTIAYLGPLLAGIITIACGDNTNAQTTPDSQGGGGGAGANTMTPPGEGGAVGAGGKGAAANGGKGGSGNSGTGGRANSSGGNTSTTTGGSGNSTAGGNSGATGGTTGGTGGMKGDGGAAAGGATGAGGAGKGAGGAGNGGAASGGSGGGSAVDLCKGLVQDKAAHPMTALGKPAVGAVVTDAEFGTKMRRITAVQAGGNDSAIIPMYTTISAWNADESYLILFDISGEHRLYDGKTYQFIKALDISPADIEQVYWHTSDPDILYYVDNQTFVRYHVKTGAKDNLHNFSGLCGSSSVSNGDDPMFTSWDSHRIGLYCGSKMFLYDISTDAVLGQKSVSGTPPPQVAPSGTLLYLPDGSGQVLDPNLNLVRSLTLQVPYNHASLGQLANGHDTWNGAVYDDGNDDAKSDVGILVTWDLTNGKGGAVIGPKTGYPYPPDGHISAMAYGRPGWVFVSTYGNTDGHGLLDLENLVADTNTGTVCRVGRHRSWGKGNTHLNEPYWAEAHTVPSPSGTRAVFASDWGNGTTVDTYVLELPSYSP